MDEAPAKGRSTAARQAEADASDPWRYRPHEHGSPAAFALHPDFQRFREHVAALTRELSAVDKDSPSTAASLQTFRDHVTTVDGSGYNRFFGENAEEIYGKGAEDLERLVQLIRDPQVDRGQARAEIRELSSRLALCSTAVTEELPASLRRLSPPPRTLPAKWHDAQVNLVRHSAAETLRLSALKTTNRHAVNALLPVLYKDVGLPDQLPDDPFVLKDLPKSVVEEARRRLEEDLRPSSVALRIADDYLMRLSASVNGPDAAASSSPLLTLERMEEAVQALAAEFGSKPPTSAAFRVDPATGDCVVATDATLVAVHFLRCWRRDSASRRRDKPSRMPPVARPVKGPAFMTAGCLAWAETHGECRLLELDDLPALKPDDLPGAALLSVIRNSAPDDLWTRLPAEWMRDKATFDALLDRIDDTALRACFERWQSASTPLSKDQQVLLMEAVLGRGRGAALFEGETLAWQRLTRPHLHDAGSLRMLYRQRQAGQLTSTAFGESLAKAWTAAQQAGVLDLLRVSMPGSSLDERHYASGQFAKQWLCEAAQALSSTPPQVTIQEISEAIGSGTHALSSGASKENGNFNYHAVLDTISALRSNQVVWGNSQQAHDFRPEHASVLLRSFLDLDAQGRSSPLSYFWRHARYKSSLFKMLEETLQALVKYGCNWSELVAILSFDGQPTKPGMLTRLEYARAFVIARSYPDGPVRSDLLPEGFSEIPTERKAFRDVATQHDDTDVQA
ncbi:hypothetical protein ABE85_20600 [Mitsuaria sp. 7]|nr:hypothetical protein ABE85_20600 [Mitsuaria sp. 7]